MWVRIECSPGWQVNWSASWLVVALISDQKRTIGFISLSRRRICMERDLSLACACEYNWKWIAHMNENGLRGWKAKGCSKCLIHALGNVCRRMGMRRLSRLQLKWERRVAMGTRDIWTFRESPRPEKGVRHTRRVRDMKNCGANPRKRLHSANLQIKLAFVGGFISNLSLSLAIYSILP